jgi:hypothetical protein
MKSDRERASKRPIVAVTRPGSLLVIDSVTIDEDPLGPSFKLYISEGKDRLNWHALYCDSFNNCAVIPWLQPLSTLYDSSYILAVVP